jgi:hypothetical protein
LPANFASLPTAERSKIIEEFFRGWLIILTVWAVW